MSWCVFEGTIFENILCRAQFLKCIFWKSNFERANFENVFFGKEAYLQQVSLYFFKTSVLPNFQEWLLFGLCTEFHKTPINDRFLSYTLNFLKIHWTADFFFLPITTKYIQQLITMLLKIKLIKQDNAGHLFYFFNKQNKNKNTHTHTHTKKRQKNKTRWNYLLPPPSLIILNGVSINHMINRMPFL